MRITFGANKISKLFLSYKLREVNYIIGLMLCVCGISFTAAAAPWDLDPTFGSGGKVVSSQNDSGGTSGKKIALLPNGKIAMIGNKLQSAQYLGTVVSRYNADGSLDTTFGTNGWASVTFGFQQEVAEAIDVQPDGKIVIGSLLVNVISNVSYFYFGIARFNTDGTLDTTFDGDGKLTVDFSNVVGEISRKSLSAVKVGNDGKIIAAGVAVEAAANDRYIFTRLNPDGSYDAGFGANGRLADQVLSLSNTDQMHDMIILPDGKFVAIGNTRNFSNRRVAIKYSAGGIREWKYEQGVSVPQAENESFRGIVPLPDGKFIVVGKRAAKVVVMRLNANGTEDTSFISAPGMPDGQALSVAIQSNGKIVVNIESDRFTLARFNADGAPDTTFGGIISTSISGGSDYATKVIIQPDGKYLLGGSATVGTPTPYYFALARFKGETSATVIKPMFDYDGDGRSDVSVFRPSENKWFILRSSDSSVAQPIFGSSGDIPAPSDFDGDGKTDPAVFRPSTGVWWYLSSLNGNQIAAQWGQNGDIPRPSDFDGDGKADFIVFRPSDNKWYRLSSSGTGSSIVEFGSTGDKPLVGDFDGDGKSDPAIYRPSTGVWWYAASGSAGAHRAAQFGIATDTPVPADYDGDGKTDFAVYRSSNGVWHILQSGRSSGNNYIAYQFGIGEDKPVAADYDGDGKADMAVFRPSTGSWYQMRTTSGFSGIQWGTANDIPTPNAFVP